MSDKLNTLRPWARKLIKEQQARIELLEGKLNAIHESVSQPSRIYVGKDYDPKTGRTLKGDSIPEKERVYFSLLQAGFGGATQDIGVSLVPGEPWIELYADSTLMVLPSVTNRIHVGLHPDRVAPRFHPFPITKRKP